MREVRSVLVNLITETCDFIGVVPSLSLSLLIIKASLELFPPLSLRGDFSYLRSIPARNMFNKSQLWRMMKIYFRLIPNRQRLVKLSSHARDWAFHGNPPLRCLHSEQCRVSQSRTQTSLWFVPFPQLVSMKNQSQMSNLFDEISFFVGIDEISVDVSWRGLGMLRACYAWLWWISEFRSSEW